MRHRPPWPRCPRQPTTPHLSAAPPQKRRLGGNEARPEPPGEWGECPHSPSPRAEPAAPTGHPQRSPLSPPFPSAAGKAALRRARVTPSRRPTEARRHPRPPLGGGPAFERQRASAYQPAATRPRAQSAAGEGADPSGSAPPVPPPPPRRGAHKIDIPTAQSARGPLARRQGWGPMGAAAGRRPQVSKRSAAPWAEN